MDFEQGNFTNWVCRSGTVAISGGVNTITWNATGVMPTLHRIAPTSIMGIDQYGGFPKNCPNGSGFSAMIGNETATTNGGIGWEASGVSYTYSIPASATVFSIFFHYAVVLQNPGHTAEAQPRFRARIKDITIGQNIPCVTFDFTASSSLPGFLPSPINSSVLYKDWTPVTLNLSGMAGKTIELEFIASECTQGGHFAYAYIDVNSNCNGAIAGTTICQGDNSITLVAPFGFASYRWFADNTFSTVISTNQSLPLNPAPAVGTIIPVEVTPYLAFGCKDTLYANITVSPKPVSVAGPDASICKYQTAQLGGPSAPGYTYNWRPANLVSNPSASNPVGWNVPPQPAEIIVKTTDILTGCFSEDTTIISNIVVDTVLRMSGPSDFCIRDNLATLSVNNNIASAQWYNSTIPISGATGFTFVPVSSGNYWAQVIQNGCTDTTRQISVNVHPLPMPSFVPDEDTLCITNAVYHSQNTSSSPDNAAMTYNWKFSDGVALQTTDADRTFSHVGNYSAELVATTQWGCKDSVSAPVYVLPNGIADFLWDSICINRPVLFTNLSNENNSAQVNYSWQFDNGEPPYTVKNPPPVLYSNAEMANVILELSTLGCEDYPQSVTKQVQVNPGHKGVTYKSITVPQASSQLIHVRDSIGSIFYWKPQIQLSRYDKQFTEFFATGDDVKYLIDITDEHTCVTTDTLLMQVLKKPGYYLATGFTPNGDGLNDVLTPYLIGMKALKSFSVFNRWGNMVFYSTKYGESWDGKIKGLEAEAGVYVWQLEYYDKSDTLIKQKGTVTLIR